MECDSKRTTQIDSMYLDLLNILELRQMHRFYHNIIKDIFCSSWISQFAFIPSVLADSNFLYTGEP